MPSNTRTKLPNFICVQVTKRKANLDGSGYWRTLDIIQVRLTYNEHRESYQVVTINDPDHQPQL